MKVKFTIPGEVVPQGRPRATHQQGFTRLYQPQKCTNFQNLVSVVAQQEMQSTALLEGPLRLSVLFYLSIPQSSSKKKKKLMSDARILPTKKPDLDNAIKGVMDGLTEIVYHDDKQITELSVAKFFSDLPRTEVTIEQLDAQGV